MITSSVEAAVTVSGLSFSYRERNGDLVEIYRDFGLSLERGKVTALMGRSGSGKSTLGKILGGEVSAEQGTVTWDAGLSDPLDHFYLNQDPQKVFFPHQTVRENVSYALLKRFPDHPDPAGRTRQLLEDFGLAELADKYPLYTSGGQQRRLALARVLAWEPKALILDEYLSALDERTRADVVEILEQRVKEQGMTIIMITHERSDALRLADRCIELDGHPARVVDDAVIDRSLPYLATADVDSARAARSRSTAPVSRRLSFPSAWAFLAVLAVWWGVTAAKLVDPILLPSPVAVAKTLVQLATKESLATDVWVTARRVLVGLAFASVIGIPLGLFFGQQRRLYGIVEGPLNALRSVPATCLFPLLLIVVGVGEKAIITLAAYPCTLILIVLVAAGAGHADPSRVRQAKILGVSSFQMVKDVLFFEALPSVISGLKTSVSYALVLVIAVEMFIGVGQAGLGRKIFDYQSNYRIPETWAAIAMTALFGLVLNFLVNLLGKRLLHWKPEAQEASMNTS